MEINLGVAFRQDFGIAIAHRINRRLHDLGGVHEPLIGQHRFDHHFRAVAKRLHDWLVFHVWHKNGAVPDLLRDLLRHLLTLRPRRGGRGCVALGLGRRCNHHRQAFGGNVGHNLAAHVKPVKPAIFVRHKVDRIHLGLGEIFAINNGLCFGSLVPVRRTIAAHRAFGVHQPVTRDIAALGDRIVVEIMRAGDFYST